MWGSGAIAQGCENRIGTLSLMPKLSVVVLNWNRRELTERCIESIRAHTDTDFELIMVDNGSDEPTPQWTEEVADVAVLNPANLGFAPGMNAGLRVARGEFVAFANNDTVFPSSWASRLLETFAAYPSAGIVLPAVTAAGNPYAVREAPGSHRLVVPAFRELPSGVVYVVRTADMRALGGWDERYHMASREDLDLLFMMWCNNREVVLDERVLVEHESSATVNDQRDEKREYWRENWGRFIERWTDPDDVPILAGVDEEIRLVRLREAQTAAVWMARWMEERQRFYAKNREWKSERKHRQMEDAQVSAALEQASTTRRWWRR